jgi:uncharacterized repeat protein (TIGR01451 family)
MSSFRAWVMAAAVLALTAGAGKAQVGAIYPPGTNSDSAFLCVATAAETPELRPEGYTELLGDIVISCNGGQLLQVGSPIPTVNIVVYLSPALPITSRILGAGGASEVMLLVDEPGTNLTTGATGGYGPQAPQSLCTTAQQQSYSNPCQAAVGLDQSGQYEVAVVPGTSKPAQNVFQGKIGDYGPNTVAFYNVPVLPPVYNGVSRTYRITNIRLPIAAGSSLGLSVIQGFVAVSTSTAMPMAGPAINLGVVGPAMTASVNATPTGGGNPFGTCLPVTSPALAARLTFTEGFATAFKTRVVPGGPENGIPGLAIANVPWAAEGLNLAAPFNQNIPGGLYGGFEANTESLFILAAANTTVADVSYTAGLADFGTRLKAVFSNIPAGVSLYVSTTSTVSIPIPGGTSVTPYAVLVAASQGNEGNGDGTSFAPLTSAIAGSDGLYAYPLSPDSSGVTAAVWEVTDSNPARLDTLSFSVYLSYASTAGTISPPNVALSMAPEPGGGTFSTVNDTQGLTSPVPRFGVVSPQGGPWATIGGCSLQAPTQTLAFISAQGAASPAGQTLAVTTVPSNLPVTVTTASTASNWLSASVSGGTLTVSANPAGLGASSNPYTGSVTLLATGVSPVSIPVTFTVSPPVAALSVTKTHTGSLSVGQAGTYWIVVSNSASAQPTQGTVTVTDAVGPGLTLAAMSGSGWSCSTLPYCTRGDQLPPGQSWGPITVTVNVAANPPSRVVNQALVTGGASAGASAYDIADFGAIACTGTGDANASASDVQFVVNEALGYGAPAYDLNGDGAVNAVDVQIVINAVLGKGCSL